MQTACEVLQGRWTMNTSSLILFIIPSCLHLGKSLAYSMPKNSCLLAHPWSCKIVSNSVYPRQYLCNAPSNSLRSLLDLEIMLVQSFLEHSLPLLVCLVVNKGGSEYLASLLACGEGHQWTTVIPLSNSEKARPFWNCDFKALWTKYIRKTNDT